MAASAAYWIGSAADTFSMTPSSHAGSVGAVLVHYDESAANEAAGVKPTYITYGANKAETNSDGPLTAEALAHLQALVNDCGENFVKAVATNRRTTQANVRDTYGQGRVFTAADCLKLGMADQVETIDALASRLAGSKATRARVATEHDRDRLRLEAYR